MQEKNCSTFGEEIKLYFHFIKRMVIKQARKLETRERILNIHIHV